MSYSLPRSSTWRRVRSYLRNQLRIWQTTVANAVCELRQYIKPVKGALKFVSSDGVVQYLTEADISYMLIDRAIDISRNKRVRWNLSEIDRGMLSLTNDLRDSRDRALKKYPSAEGFFPVAFRLRDELMELLHGYCMLQDVFAHLDWENEVVVRIQALAQTIQA